MSNFHKGQKVVCIRNPWPCRVGGIILPRYGAVYTVKDIVYYANSVGGQCVEPGLQLVEIPDQDLGDYVVVGFGVWGFRPAVERGTRTGMAMLHKLLTDNMVNA